MRRPTFRLAAHTRESDHQVAPAANLVAAAAAAAPQLAALVMFRLHQASQHSGRRHLHSEANIAQAVFDAGAGSLGSGDMCVIGRAGYSDRADWRFRERCCEQTNRKRKTLI